MTPEEVDQLETESPDGQRQPQQQRIERAALGGKRQVADLVLQPYSASREAAAHTMGLTYGAVDEAGRTRFGRTGMYPGLVKDVAIIMWLCAKATEDEIDGASVDGKSARQQAFEWARHEELFDTQGDKFNAAYTAFFEIMDEVWSSRTRAKKKKDSAAALKNQT